MKNLLLGLAALAALTTSCQKDKDEAKNGMYKGPQVKMYSGKAWTWVETKKDGTPERIAVSIDDAALNSVPMQSAHPGTGGHMHETSFVLKFHPRAEETIFKHVLLDWNAAGHEPPGVYDLPHFDLHYYMTSNEDRMKIPPYETDIQRFDNLPAPAYFPPSYIPFPGGVPAMGKHWGDPTSGEFRGQKFTETFIYGSYNGKVTYYEPMITLDFVKSHPAFDRPIPQPAKFQKTGHYPTRFKMMKHNGVTDFILYAFVYRQQS